MNTQKIKFKNGCEIPALGLGTWKAEPGEVGEDTWVTSKPWCDSHEKDRVGVGGVPGHGRHS